MIILNDKEMKSKYTIENKIINIRNKPKNIKDLYEDVLNDNDLSGYFIESYKFSPSSEVNMADVQFAGLVGENEPKGMTGLYTKIYTQDEFDANREASRVYNRPDEFVNYEKFLYNRPTDYQFTKIEEPLSKEEFFNEIQAAAGILPSLWNESDLSYEEKIQYSKAGENLIRQLPQTIIATDNPVPDRKNIELYMNLSSGEKKLINRKKIHPRQLFDLIKLIKIEGTKDDGSYIFSNRLITKNVVEDLEALADKNGKFSIKTVANEITSAKYPNEVERIKSMFEKAFRGHCPKVVNEYVEGKLAILGIEPGGLLADKTLENIVSGFNQKNVSKVAKYKNSTLFALDGILNFGEYKETILETLAINIDPKNLKMLNDKKFFDYIKERKDLSIAEIENLLERGQSKRNTIKMFDVDKEPQELINAALCEAGERARLSYEKQYNYKFADNEIAIKGRHLCVQEGKKKIFILPKDDLRNFIVGDSSAGGVSCCQHYGGAGGSCVWKVTEDPFAGNVIIEIDGQIAAQAFVWTDEVNKTFVFDNFEYKNDSNANGYMNLIGTFVKNLPYPNVHIGMGYTEGTAWNGVGQLVKDLDKSKHAKIPATLSDRKIYSDYHPTGNYQAARALKVDGQMVRFNINETLCHVTCPEDEPTKYDILASDTYNFMLNDNKHSVEDRIKIAESYLNDPDNGNLKVLFTQNQDAIKAFDLNDEMQKFVLETYPDRIEEIKNPNNMIKAEIIRRDPGKLFIYDNPPEDLVLAALETDGLLIRHIKEPTDAMYKKAIEQNGYALMYIPKDKWTNEFKREAIKTSPKLITKMPYDSALIRTAINADKNIFYLINDAKEEDKMYAIEHNPGLINSIKEPSEALVSKAVSLNGLLIRNFQKEYPNLRVAAIEQNPFAIRVLKNLTKEEAQHAIEIDARCAIAIKDETLLDELGIQRANPFTIFKPQEVKEDAPAFTEASDDTFGIDIETF